MGHPATGVQPAAVADQAVLGVVEVSTSTPAGSQPQRPGPGWSGRITVPSGCRMTVVGGRPGASR